MHFYRINTTTRVVERVYFNLIKICSNMSDTSFEGRTRTKVFGFVIIFSIVLTIGVYTDTVYIIYPWENTEDPHF